MLLGHSVADGNGNILTLDQAVCDLLQRSKRELVGMSYEQLTHPDDLPKNMQQLGCLNVGDRPLRLRKRYLRPQGEAVWTMVDVSRFSVGPDVGRLVASIYLLEPDHLDRRPENLWRAAHRIDGLVRRRMDEFGEELFGDHAWVILLQLYLAEAEGRIVDASAISDRTRISAVAIDRWLKLLQLKKLVERPVHTGRMVQLTATGLQKIETLLDASIEI